MKKILVLFTILIIMDTFAFCQAPKSFKYQAIVRDKNGTAITTNNISLQISIIQDTSVGGTIVYSEIFTNVKPTNIGMVNLDIGKGTIVTGNFSKIDWGNHKFYIGINMDPNGGSNYQAMGTSELLSVPYALYAATAGNSGSSNLNLTGTGSTTVTGSYPNYTINGGYQYLKSSNDTIYLTNGGFVKLPYTAGTGIGITGTIINNTMPNNTHTGDAVGSGALKVVAIQGNPISSINPSNNQVLSWNGSNWAPASVAGQLYNAGTGISITGSTILNTSPNMTHTGDVIGSGALTVVAIQGKAISTDIPSINQVLNWNGSIWSPTTINTYYAGTGLTISGNTFINTSPNMTHSGDVTGSGILTVVAIQGNPVVSGTPTTNQVLSWNGSAWSPITLSGSSGSYYAGTGLSLTGNTFSCLAHTGDAIGQTNLTVIAIQGKGVSTTAPAFNQVLSWNGSLWAPAANAGQAYFAGAGLSITGNTFYHTPHTGDATGQTSLTVVALQGNPIATTAPTTNQVLSWNGSVWIPTNSASTHYIGQLYGGGMVYWVDYTGSHGYILSLVDISTTDPWSNVSSFLIGSTAQSTWDGKNNTIAIMGQSGFTGGAALDCHNYTNANYGTGVYNDWYLPAINELNLIYNACFTLNKTLSSISGVNIISQGYWSSTEVNSGNAYIYGMIIGNAVSEAKYAPIIYTRAVRAF